MRSVELVVVVFGLAGCSTSIEQQAFEPLPSYFDSESGLTYYYEVGLGNGFPEEDAACVQQNQNPQHLWVLVKLWSGTDNQITDHVYVLSCPRFRGMVLTKKIVSDKQFRSIRTTSDSAEGYLNWLRIKLPYAGDNKI